MKNPCQRPCLIAKAFWSWQILAEVKRKKSYTHFMPLRSSSRECKMNQTWLNVPKPPTSRNTTLQKKIGLSLMKLLSKRLQNLPDFLEKYENLNSFMFLFFIHLEPKLLEKKTIFVFSDSKNKVNFENSQ